LTAQRRDKVATMKWDDIKDGVWVIRSEKREKSNAGSLRLPQAVLDIIERQPRLAGNPHIFPAGKGDGPFNSFSQRKEELDAKLPRMPGWVIHDLRRTAKTLMARANVRPHISERVLGHAIKGVEGVYDQHDYGREKAQALVLLASQIDQIINPPPKAKVARLDEHRRKQRRR
jgi:integrase